MATLYLDLLGGNDSNDGLSFANRKRTIGGVSGAVAAASAGDTIRVMETPPNSLGTCTWTNGGGVALPANTVKNLYMDGTWTGVTNCTVTSITTTARMEGSNRPQFAILAAFTTGKCAYYDLGSAQDFSAYDSVSFWIIASVAGTNFKNLLRLRLCSDTTGDTVVDELIFEDYQVAANTWTPIKLTKAGGASLGSSIRSISFAVQADLGAVNVGVDCMFATSGISLLSAIGKNTGSPEAWYSIRSINADNVILQQGTSNNTVATTAKGYPGTTESVTSYWVVGHSTASTVAAGYGATAVYHAVTKAASEGSPLTISGGWDTTAMTSQVGKTWVTALHGVGRLIGGTHSWITINNFGFNGGTDAWYCGGVGCVLTDSFCAGSSYVMRNEPHTVSDCVAACNITGWYFGANYYGLQASNLWVYNNSSHSFFLSGNRITCSNTHAANGSDSGFYISGSLYRLDTISVSKCTYGLELLDLQETIISNALIEDNTIAGIGATNNVSVEIYDLETSGNTNIGINCTGTYGGNLKVFGWVHDESSVVSGLAYTDANYVFSINDGGTADNHKIYGPTCNINSQTAVRHTASGIAWEIKPTSASMSARHPAVHPIKGIPVKGGVSHTASVWMRRTNTGITGVFKIGGNQLPGIAETTDSISVAADTWEELTLTFTPTVDGVVDFEILAYGGTTYTLYWDDFSITAASSLDTRSGNYAYRNAGVFVSGMVDSPAVADVEDGVFYDWGTKEGTLVAGGGGGTVGHWK